MENDSQNAISWVLSSSKNLCRFQFFFNEIRSLSLSIQVEFWPIGQMANGFLDVLAIGFAVDRSLGLVITNLQLLFSFLDIMLLYLFALLLMMFWVNGLYLLAFLIYFSIDDKKNVVVLNISHEYITAGILTAKLTNMRYDGKSVEYKVR